MSKYNCRKFLKKTSLASAAVGTSSFYPEFLYGPSERLSTSKYMGGFAAPKPEGYRTLANCHVVHDLNKVSGYNLFFW